MKIEIRLKDLIVYGLIFLFAVFCIMQIIQIKAEMKMAGLFRTVEMHDSNFPVIKNALEDFAKRIQAIELQRIIDHGDAKLVEKK